MTSAMADPPLARLTTNTQQTWQSNSSSGSSTSYTRHGLNPDDRSPIVVFHWNGSRPLEKSSEADLGHELEGHDEVRVTKMPIPKMTSYVEVKRHNLYKGSEHQQFRNYPTYNSSLASIKLPANVYWSRLVGGYENLYIVSPEMSPSSSPSSSFAASDDSDKVSSSSYAHHDAYSGAEKV